MITNDQLAFSIEREYEGAKNWLNFWVGFENINGDGVQACDSEVIGWNLDFDVPSDIGAIVLKWSSEYQDFLNVRRIESLGLRRDSLVKELDYFVSNPILWMGLTEAQKKEASDYRLSVLKVDLTRPSPEFPSKPDFLVS